MNRLAERKRGTSVPDPSSIWDIPDGDAPLSSSTEVNEQALRTLFAKSSDLVFRRVDVPDRVTSLLVFVDGLIDNQRVEEAIIPYLVSYERRSPPSETQGDAGFTAFSASQVTPVKTLGELVKGILKSDVAVLSEGKHFGVLVSMAGFTQRGIQEPTGENVVRGPREGFVESLRTNTSMLRRRLKTYRLKMESLTIGQGSQTDVVIAYVEGVANEGVLKELRLRLRDTRLDAVPDSLSIEEFIEDNSFSPFSQVQNSERPDVVAMALMEGRISLFVDGSPQVLLVPMTLWYGLQTAQDYYERWIFTTTIRVLRFILLILSITLTPLYVAVVTFHPQLLPSNLMLSIAAAREPNPFPTAVEAFIMEFMFESLREAGIRLPQSTGAAVSIVGGIIVGQAAIDAGFLTAPLVIVVAVAGIASFSIPQYNIGFSFRILRFAMLFGACTMGLYGLTIGLLAILIHLVHLRSFGVPYLSPVSPDSGIANLRDTLLRAPRWVLSRSRGFLANGAAPAPKTTGLRGRPRSNP